MHPPGPARPRPTEDPRRVERGRVARAVAHRVGDGDLVAVTAGRAGEAAAHLDRVGADHQLVGVDPEDPGAGALAQGGVARAGEVVVPVAADDGRTDRLGQLGRPVDRAGVVDDDLVDDVLERIQAGADAGRLVADDEAGGDERAVGRGLFGVLCREDRTVALLQGEPVDLVGVEGLVPDVVDEGRVGDDEAAAGVAQPLAEVVVLVAADLEPLVEAADLRERGCLDREAEADESLDVRGAAVGLTPGAGRSAAPRPACRRRSVRRRRAADPRRRWSEVPRRRRPRRRAAPAARRSTGSA